ncbi:MAG: hypothetical protein QM704_05770 [Anaeromyxobacteraceae bacterium]
MPRSTGPLLLAASLLLTACPSSDGGGQAEDLRPIRQFELGWNVHAVGGSGATVVAQYRDTLGPDARVRVFSADPSHRGELLVRGTVDLGVSNGVAEELVVGADRAALAFQDEGRVSVIALDGAQPAVLATMDRSGAYRVAATGPWLAVTTAYAMSAVELVDLSGATPATAGTFPIGSPVTCIVPFGGGFTIFTEAGHARLQADSGGTWHLQHVTDPDVRGYRKVEVLAADVAWAAGPSPFAGKSRLDRLDLSASAPARTWTSDHAGNFETFSCDTLGGCLLATQVDGDWGSMWVSALRAEASGVRVSAPVKVFGLFRTGATTMHANAGLAYAAYAPWTAEYHSSLTSQIAIFELP